MSQLEIRQNLARLSEKNSYLVVFLPTAKQLKHHYCKFCLFFAFLIVFGQVLYGQHVWLGLRAGQSFSWNYQIREGQFVKGGILKPDYFAGTELRYQFPSRLGLSLGFQVSNFSVGAKSREEIPFFGKYVPYCGDFRMNDLYLGVSYPLAIVKDRLFFRPELAFHELLGRQSSNAYSIIEGDGGWSIATQLRIEKRMFYAAVSSGLGMEWQFRNGCVIKLGARYLQGFKRMGLGYIQSRFSGLAFEYYRFLVLPVAIQPYLGLDFPISRIWEK